MNFSKKYHSMSQHFGKHHVTIKWLASKTKIFTLLTILISFFSFSQNTYVPDDNFEQALIDLGYDTVLDDYVTTINISGVTDLDVSFQNISDLTGIEDFVALTNLDCYSNNLTSVNLSQNTALQNLDLGSNQLTRLNVSQNTQLLSLLFDNNALQGIDARLNTNLLRFYAQNNQLEYLNIKNGNNTSIIEFYANNNPALTCIEVDNAAYSTSNWTSIDAQTSFNEDCGYPETYVPDDNFEQALIDLGYDTVLDDYVTTANIDGVVSLDVSNKNIVNLTGIEGFTALTYLKCSNNQLTSLNIAQNTALTFLSCSNNQLSNLDVTQNTTLFEFYCDNNQLTSLDVSQNTALVYFTCLNNQIPNLDVTQITNLYLLNCELNPLNSLDVSQNTALNYLTCGNNLLTSLDVSQNTALIRLFCQDNQLTSLNVKNGNNANFTNFDATSNPELTCIEVDDAAYSTANWTNIDVQTSFSENCALAETYLPDDNFEQALIDLGYDTVLDDYVTTANISGVTSLNVVSKNIADLTGIEDFAALTNLFCRSNQLTSLDVSQNTALTFLDCYDNVLTSLDVTQNTALTYLACSNNLLTSLDVTQNTALIELTCSANQLTSIDVSQITGLEVLNVFENQLTSLDVTQNTVLNDLDCYNNQLTSLDISQNAALTLLACRINQLTSLDVSQNTSLIEISCDGNQLTSLDVTQNTALTYLGCTYNQLTSLNVKNGNNSNFSDFRATNNPDLSCIEVDDAAYSTANWTNIDVQTSFSENCALAETYVPDDNFEQALIDLGYDTVLDDYVTTANISGVTSLNVVSKNISDLTGIEDFAALTNLFCTDNQLTSLDVTQNTALTFLICDENQLTSLDITQNTALTYLTCDENQLTSLDITQNTLLTTLYCNNNLLTSLDVTQNTALIEFDCHVNQLTTIDLTQISGLETFICYQNQLTSLDVSQNTALTYLGCSSNQLTSLNAKNGNNSNFTGFRAGNNPDLYCIEVDNAAYSTTNWTFIDVQTSFSEDCSTLSIIDSELVDKIVVYPNPTSDIIHIDTKLLLTKVELFDIVGKHIITSTENMKQLNIGHLNAGVYILAIHSNKGKLTRKIVVE